MIKQQTLSSVFGGQVRITGGAIFPTGGANAPPVKELKMPCCMGRLWHMPCTSAYRWGWRAWWRCLVRGNSEPWSPTWVLTDRSPHHLQPLQHRRRHGYRLSRPLIPGANSSRGCATAAPEYSSAVSRGCLYIILYMHGLSYYYPLFHDRH